MGGCYPSRLIAIVSARRTAVRWALALCTAVAFAGATPGVAAAATKYVDQKNPNCTDPAGTNSSGGTATAPYCTISRAAVGNGAGTTIMVSEGTYNEEVDVRTGTVAAPLVFKTDPGETVTVTGGQYGFYLSGKTYVTVDGFNVTKTTSDGIHVSSGSSNIKVLNNTTSFAGKPQVGLAAKGISVTDATNNTVQGNIAHHNSYYGIYFANSTGNTVTDNQSSFNARVFDRNASGIRLHSSSNNTVARNVTHDNEDSGIEAHTGSNNNLIINNVTYGNGDHGIDVLDSPGQRILNNSVYHNVTAGINAEGTSDHTTMANNVSVDSGIGSPRTSSNIRVDATSVTGSTINRDLVFLHTSSIQFIWGANSYNSLAALQTNTGQETNGIEADPKWVAPSLGNFHLAAGSPAIDSADAGISGASATDIEGTARIDDPTRPNTGVGPRTYDDRGAYEYPAIEGPPTAALTVTPNLGSAPLDVTADASGSSDVDASPISTYTFDFGDGTTAQGPQAGATAKHVYASAGTYTVTVTVTDTAGRPATATAQVTVKPPPNAPPNPALKVNPSTGHAPLDVIADASLSTDPDDHPIATYAFDFGDGTATGPQAGATAAHTYDTAGTYTVTVTVTDTGGLSSSATKQVSVDPEIVPPDAALTLPPSGTAPLDVTADASRSQPGSMPIDSYKFDFGDGTVKGPQAGATASHTYTTAGTYTVTLTVVDTAGTSSTATAQITVSQPDLPPNPKLVLNQTSGPAPMAVTADASGSTDNDLTGIATYKFDFGDGTSTGAQSSATASHTYTKGGSYTVTLTVTDTGGRSSTATTSVLVFADYVTNGGFETNLTGWNTSGGGAGITLERVAGGHSGGFAAKLSNTSAGPSSCVLNDSPNAVLSTAADGSYTAKMWVRADTAGATLRLRVREYAGTTLAGSEETNTALTTSWQLVTVVYTPTAGGSSLDLNATVVNAAPGTCFYADDASLALGPKVAPPPPDPNLVDNRGFETSLTGWNTGGSGAGITLSRVAGGNSGGWAAQLTNTSTGPSSCVLNDAPNVVATTAAGIYTVSMFVRADQPGATLKLRVREYSGSTLMDTRSTDAALSTSWQQVTVAYPPAAPGASTLDVNALVVNAAPGTCFYADDVSITRA